MNFNKGFVVLFALVMSGPALADVEVYAGVGIGGSDAAAKPANVQSALVAKGYDVTGVAVDAEDSGWRFHAGLRFTEIFAVELGFVDLGDVSTRVDGNIAPMQVAQFNQDVADALPVMPRGMTLAGVARFNLEQVDKLSFAVRLGVIDADSERRASGGTRGGKSTNASPYYGVSAGWDFTPSWRGVIGYEVFNMADSTDFWSAGLEFRFPNYSQ